MQSRLKGPGDIALFPWQMTAPLVSKIPQKQRVVMSHNSGIACRELRLIIPSRGDSYIPTNEVEDACIVTEQGALALLQY